MRYLKPSGRIEIVFDASRSAGKSALSCPAGTGVGSLRGEASLAQVGSTRSSRAGAVRNLQGLSEDDEPRGILANQLAATLSFYRDGISSLVPPFEGEDQGPKI